MATLIPVTGSPTQVQPRVGKEFTLDELQEFVGGYIEIVRLRKALMYVNEEGLIHGLSYNHKASILAGKRIVGDVLVVDK
jgi:hypothetical protein